MVDSAGDIAGIVSAVLDVGKCFMSLYNHKSNLRNLETEVRRLKVERENVEGMVGVAKNNAKQIKETVEQWVSDVDSIVTEAGKLIDERADFRCFHLKARYKLRREISEKVKNVAELLQLRDLFGNKVSLPTIHEDPRLLNKDYLAFQSRLSTLEGVLEALNKAKVDIIGVHGMGGTGKTTLVKEVGRQAKENKVIFVEVTDTPNIKEIREEIANNLGLKFEDKENETERRNKFFARLKEEKTILIILDNIWVDLDLEKIGIPFGENHKGCKLLLTARDRNVLDRMGSKSFSIDVLKEDEAWNLFRKMTGEVVDTGELQSLANDVCKECGRLPIAIVTVAKALKNKRELCQWKNALQELRSPSPTEFKGVLKEAYSKIALSYNYLEGEELKKVILLCSIMTHDASISNLLKFVMGLNILEGNNLKIEEARVSLDKLLHELKESCLLLDCSSERFSMHDVVRDIAITISYKDHHVFTERNDVKNDWKNIDKLMKCTKISLTSSDIISKHWVEGLECPELEFFYMVMEGSSFKYPEKFFSRMAKLKVLRLNCFPLSISLPLGLQTLCLDGSEIGEVAMIGELKKLEILSLRGCRNIKQLPKEISQLTQLRLLDLSFCTNLQVITPDVISSLVSLEELYMRRCSVLWEVRGPNVERNNASLEELLPLSFLTVLEIDIKGEKILPKGLFSKGLKRYHISVNQDFGFHWHMRTIKLKLDSSICLSELRGMKSVEFLCLDELQNVKNGLQQLEYLHVKGCDELKFLISFSTTKILPQLQILAVEDCKNVKEIFAIEREQNVNNGSCKIEFFQLRLLTLKHLPRLGSFCSGMTTTSTSQSRHDELTLFDEKLVFPTLEALELECIGSGMIWCSHLPTFMTSSYHNLTSLTVLGCGNLKYIFPTFIVQSFTHLQHLEICECRDLKEIVANGAEATPKFVFPQVTFLKLDNLPKLTSFYLGRHLSEWPLLEKLQVCDCKKVKIFTSECGSSNENSTEAQFDISEPALFLIEKINPDLKELIVDSMIPLGILERFNNLEKLKLNGDSDEVLFSCKEEEKHIEIPMKIKHLELDHLHHLKYLWKEDCKLDPVLLFQNLTHLTVTNCHKIEMNLITPSVARSLRQLREMSICRCDMIIEVVADERDAAKDEIDFPKLKSLSLCFLENLMCFHSGNYILKFPSLEELKVMYCRNMKTFSQGVLSVSKLQKVVGECTYEWLKGDRNSLIQQLYQKKDQKALTLIGKDINQIPDEPEVDQVKALEIFKDESRSIPVEILKTFHNLESLKLKASSYKELFSCGNDDKRVGTFTQLKFLQVLVCHNLITLLPSSTSFENLISLEVKYCNGLRSLLTSSTVKSLVRLQQMTIKQCEMLTEVVANGGDAKKVVVFWKLESLSLDCLENLTSFCSGNYTFKFLSLKRLSVDNCPMMETFSGGVLSTPKLQEVVKNGLDLYGCWDYCLNTTIKQSQKMVIFPDTKVSERSSMLWDIQRPMSTSFSNRNITHLIFCGFYNLIYVFPSSLVKSFEQLQQLEIRECNVLKEIVTMDGVETTSTFVFPRVTTLKLECLPKLTSFYPEKHTSEWPVLTTLEVCNCEKVKTFTSEHLSFHENSEEAHSLLLVEKINSNLEALRLTEIESMMTWQGPFSENFFSKLKLLEIMSTNAPVGILQRFKNLERVKLDRIQSKEIFLCGEDEKTIGMPTHIRGLKLNSCYKSEYLLKQDAKIASILQNLEVLEVYSCWKLINVVPSSASFQNLKVLTVANCWAMVNLITSSAAKSLVQLTKMKIRRCHNLIEIVENDQDGEEDEIIFTKLKWLSLENLRSLTCFCTGKYTFKFPTLEELIVKNCPTMKTFCEGVLSTPRLQKVWEDKCLDIGSCSQGELNKIIQQLHKNVVHSNSKILTISGKDITPTWPDQFSSHDFGKGKSLEFIKDESTSHSGILSKIENLHVYKCCKLTTLVPSSASFENLTVLRVWHCDGLRNLISFATAKSLNQLQEMSIKHCEMMTEIVANEGDVENDEIVFSKLSSLSIADLKSFTCFCSGNYTFKFPSLRKVDLQRCPKMKTFSGGVSSAPSLWLQVEYNMEYYRRGFKEDNCGLNEIIQQLHKKNECLEL